jgi:hypothetical protein
MSGVGGGNAGVLAGQGGISGGAGLGTAGTGAGPGALSLSSNPQTYMNLLGQMPNQQQQQQQEGPKPYWVAGRIIWM